MTQINNFSNVDPQEQRLDSVDQDSANETSHPDKIRKEAKDKIQSAQSIVYLIAVVTAFYLGATAPNTAQVIGAVVVGIILAILGFFSGKSQYVLMAMLTLFVIDTIYSIVTFVMSYEDSVGFSSNSQITAMLYIARFYFAKEMFEGIMAFRTLRRVKD